MFKEPKFHFPGVGNGEKKPAPEAQRHIRGEKIKVREKGWGAGIHFKVGCPRRGPGGRQRWSLKVSGLTGGGQRRGPHLREFATFHEGGGANGNNHLGSNKRKNFWGGNANPKKRGQGTWASRTNNRGKKESIKCAVIRSIQGGRKKNQPPARGG